MQLVAFYRVEVNAAEICAREATRIVWRKSCFRTRNTRESKEGEKKCEPNYLIMKE